jgi:hypothetical protein
VGTGEAEDEVGEIVESGNTLVALAGDSKMLLNAVTIMKQMTKLISNLQVDFRYSARNDSHFISSFPHSFQIGTLDTVAIRGTFPQLPTEATQPEQSRPLGGAEHMQIPCFEVVGCGWCWNPFVREFLILQMYTLSFFKLYIYIYLYVCVC